MKLQTKIIIGIAVVLVLGGIGFAIWWFLFRNVVKKAAIVKSAAGTAQVSIPTQAGASSPAGVTVLTNVSYVVKPDGSVYANVGTLNADGYSMTSDGKVILLIPGSYALSDSMVLFYVGKDNGDDTWTDTNGYLWDYNGNGKSKF